MKKNISRVISRTEACILWGLAAGRCEFHGCNKLLYCSEISGDQGNFSNQAHIYSFESNGPRGHTPLNKNPGKINSIENLMLLCPEHHKNIDTAEYISKYPTELLLQWKKEHEDRIRLVTSINSNCISHVLIYQANIHGKFTSISTSEAQVALFKEGRYPENSTNSINLSMQWEKGEHQKTFWQEEQENLHSRFNQDINPVLKTSKSPHFSLFALAPMPLLVELGSLLTDRTDVDVYQPIKEPKGWIWPNDQIPFDYTIIKPEKMTGIPVLVLSLSDYIATSRISDTLGYDTSLWQIITPKQFRHNDHLRSKTQLRQYRNTLRLLLAEIRFSHGHHQPLHIFLAAPVACCIELGRIRTQKVDPLWILYDHVQPQNQFIKTITIGESHE